MSFDSRDIASLFKTHGPMVYARARRLLGNHAEAEEATQDIFIRVMLSGRPSEASDLVPWLSRITTNLCLNRLRDERRRRQIQEEKLKPHDHAVADSRTPDLLAVVRSLLAEADEREAQAAIYVFIDGMSHQEVAGVLGVSKRTVGNLIERFVEWAHDRGEAPSARASSSGGKNDSE